MENLFILILLLIFLKASFVGGDFDFCQWYKHRKKYTTWYFSRQTWKEFLKEEEHTK